MNNFGGGLPSLQAVDGVLFSTHGIPIPEHLFLLQAHFVIHDHGKGLRLGFAARNFNMRSIPEEHRNLYVNETVHYTCYLFLNTKGEMTGAMSDFFQLLLIGESARPGP
jgi:hypothetical protein